MIRATLRGVVLASALLFAGTARADASPCNGRHEPPPCTVQEYSGTNVVCLECAPGDASCSATLTARGYGTQCQDSRVQVLCAAVCPSDILQSTDVQCTACAAADTACAAALQAQGYWPRCVQQGSGGESTVLCRAPCTAAARTYGGDQITRGAVCQECAASDTACADALGPYGYTTQCTDARAGGDVDVLCKQRCSVEDAASYWGLVGCEECAASDAACLQGHPGEAWRQVCTDLRPDAVELYCPRRTPGLARRGAAVPAAGLMLVASVLASLGIRRKR